jgi:hypothetical protein|tara:strand:+ start:3713 stop:4249 length:537 start_codon:yes stop_codon:yes gene_type:complete
MLSQEQLEILIEQQQKDNLSKREERYHYYGILAEYQLHPASLVNSLSYTKLNPYQHFLFKRVLHGLKVYKPEEVRKLHWDKKRRITKVWKRGQREINAWKQTICNKRVNAYLSKTFKHSPLAQYIANIPATEVLEDYTNTMNFKELGITYEDVILKFMSLGLLPKNYLELKNEHQKSI